ncbi:MAG: hypothetical protein U0359_39150 [Byssovorax sp.]
MGLVSALAAALAGCPIYGNGESSSGSSCMGSECGTTSSSSGNPGRCGSPDECAANQTCGSDGTCHPGDCSLWGCVTGYTCAQNADLTVSCQPGGGTGGSGTGGSSSGTGGTGTGGSSTTTGTGGSGTGGSGTGGMGTGGMGTGGGPAVVYCGNPEDCSAGQTCAPNGTCQPGDCTANGCIFGFTCKADGTCASANPAACGSNADCSSAGAGYACVSGICTAPGDQCFDQTQCPAGDKCAAGKCTPSCKNDADCPADSGYLCDTGLGLCTKPALACTITNDCGGVPTLVCVDGACIPRSMGPTCDAGDVWVQNGCLPDQKASFVCNADGVQDVCAASSICLHHSCYISCDPAQNPNACTNLASFNQCKSVTTGSGPHNVCGSSQNLGTDCDPTDPAKACQAGKVCIDGFCK